MVRSVHARLRTKHCKRLQAGRLLTRAQNKTAQAKVCGSTVVTVVVVTWELVFGTRMSRSDDTRTDDSTIQSIFCRSSLRCLQARRGGAAFYLHEITRTRQPCTFDTANLHFVQDRMDTALQESILVKSNTGLTVMQRVVNTWYNLMLYRQYIGI